MYSHFFLAILQRNKKFSPTVFYNQIFNPLLRNVVHACHKSSIFIFKFKVKDNWSTHGFLSFSKIKISQYLFSRSLKEFSFNFDYILPVCLKEINVCILERIA